MDLIRPNVLVHSIIQCMGQFGPTYCNIADIKLKMYCWPMYCMKSCLVAKFPLHFRASICSTMYFGISFFSFFSLIFKF